MLMIYNLHVGLVFDFSQLFQAKEIFRNGKWSLTIFSNDDRDTVPPWFQIQRTGRVVLGEIHHILLNVLSGI